jgi:hypothetical protein
MQNCLNGNWWLAAIRALERYTYTFCMSHIARYLFINSLLCGLILDMLRWPLI